MNILRYSMIVYVSLALTACDTSSRKADTDDIKKVIDEIMAHQESAYDENTDEAKIRFASTCNDSLFYVGGDNGGFAKSAQVYVHDFADGYIEKPHDKQYLIFDQTAIVTFLYKTFKVFGNDTIYFNSRGTKVFVQNDGEWKMAYVTYAPLPVHYFRQKQVKKEILEKYAGSYRENNEDIATVSISEGKLFLTSDGYRSELVPANDSTFIGEGYFGKTVFATKNNRVTHHYFEFPDGQRLSFPRVD